MLHYTSVVCSQFLRAMWGQSTKLQKCCRYFLQSIVKLIFFAKLLSSVVCRRGHLRLLRPNVDFVKEIVKCSRKKVPSGRKMGPREWAQAGEPPANPSHDKDQCGARQLEFRVCLACSSGCSWTKCSLWVYCTNDWISNLSHPGLQRLVREVINKEAD